MAPILQSPENAMQHDDQRWHGRLYSPDPRDRLHSMQDKLVGPRKMKAADLKRRTQAPMKGATLDQGPTPKCVQFSAATAASAAPLNYTRDAGVSIRRVKVAVDGQPDLYSWAQKHDEWPGEYYEGTSVRAGQEYLKRVGLSLEYVWARNLDEAKDYISRVGSAPIILGIDWLRFMDEPKLIGGDYWLDVEGDVVGGHAICCLWFDKRRDAWKLQNSWGEDWGNDGIVYLPDAMFDYLVFQANGEAVSFVEAKTA